MGLLGTNKKTVGPNSGANVEYKGGQFARGTSGADNGGDVTKSQSMADAMAAALNAVKQAAGLKNDNDFWVGQMQLFEKDGKFISRVGDNKREFTDQSSALSAFLSDALSKFINDGATRWENTETKYIADNVRKALDASIGQPIEKMLENLQFASTDFAHMFDTVGKTGPDQFSTDLTALSVSFQTTRNEAARLGLTTTGMAESFQGATDRVYAAAMRAQKGLGVVDTVLTAIESWRQASIALMGAGLSPQPAMDLLGAQLSNIVNAAGDGVEGLQRLTEAAAILRSMGESTGAAWVELRASQLREQVMNDLAAQAMEAEVALGRLSQEEYDRRTLERQQREALASVTDAGNRAITETLSRWQKVQVDEFDWTRLPADDQRLLVEALNRYQNSVLVDRFDFSQLPADTQRRVAELLARTFNGTSVADWSPIVLPGNASRTVSETVTRDVTETVTAAAMRDLTEGFAAVQLHPPAPGAPALRPEWAGHDRQRHGVRGLVGGSVGPDDRVAGGCDAGRSGHRRRVPDPAGRAGRHAVVDGRCRSR